MSDYDEYDDEQPETEADQKRNWRRDLESRAKKADENAKAADEAKRELAFYKAGIDMTDPRMTYFVKGYDGPLTAEAIKNAATEAGFLAASTQEPDLKSEIEQHQRLTDAATGVTSSAGKLTQAEVLALAAKAGNAVSPDRAAAAYHAVLVEHGLTKVQQAPSR